ncbi:MAG: tetratricopeptide repeat protein [Chloroflexota bacterium]
MDFQSLPEDYRHLIRLAEDTHKITITPLQLLVGGWSGAVVFLVSISSTESRQVEHCILKLDHKSKNARSDEITRHTSVVSTASPEFSRAHIAELVYERVEYESAIGIFYRIAGQSLLDYLPLSRYERQNQLKTLFARTNSVLLDEWNTNITFEQAVHPQKVLQKWLGFRLDSGSSTERFLEETCRVNPETGGLLINGQVFPNPFLYARKPEFWGRARPMDVATGFIHGDLNTNNILAKFAEDQESLTGYYLIDFALFKENMPLLYDQRYLEMSYLIQAISHASFAKAVHFLTRLSQADSPDPQKVSIEMAGVSAVVGTGRSAFAAWMEANHPSLRDDLWGQYWLAGVAAGLSYAHKAAQPPQQRLAGLIYAAANLKRFTTLFGLPLPAEVELLYDENHPSRDSFEPAKAKQTKNNLPLQSTPFIGRTKQLAAIKDLILKPEVRLLTLTGPGGSGKTRLSVQAAQEVVEQFPNGVFFVPLAEDKDIGQFISRVAQQLEVREGGRPLLENIKDYLRDKRMLLVLDNFEQLLPAAPVVAELLTAAPRLKIITSSRIALNLYGEHGFPVPPLELPHTEEVAPENLLNNESVLLFVRRAQAVHPAFHLTKENAPAVAEICRRLDGLPLAIELAAARIKLLPPQAILARLDDRLKLLTGGARDLPTRQQTLRNTLEWSYGLLNHDEKILYARLGIFAGGFTLEAAEAVCNPDGGLNILESLTALVNNSLLRQLETFDGAPRFEMLETIRAYAVERLAESGEQESIRTAHARYYGGIILNQAGRQIYSSNSIHWLNWFDQELDNIRATLSGGLSSLPGIQLGAVLLFALSWFWYRRGLLMEGLEWGDKYLALPEVQNSPPLRALALGSSGMVALWQGKQDVALSKLQQAFPLAQMLEDDLIVATTRMAMGIAFINMGKDNDARPLLEQSSHYFKQANQPYFHALTLVHLGNAELGLGNPEQSRAYHEEGLAMARAINENWLISFALNNLGEVARTQGQFDLARKYYEECIALLHPSGDRGDVARFVHNLGYIAQHEEEFELAESLFRESLTMFRRLGNRRGIAESLAGLAGLKARQGKIEWGAVLLNAAESILKVTGGAWWPADRVEVERNLEMLHAALTADEFAHLHRLGAGMNIDQAIAFASHEL